MSRSGRILVSGTFAVCLWHGSLASAAFHAASTTTLQVACKIKSRSFATVLTQRHTSVLPDLPNPFETLRDLAGSVVAGSSDSNTDDDGFDSTPTGLIVEAKRFLATDLGVLDPSALADDFRWISPALDQPLSKEEYIAAGRFFNLRQAFPDLDYRPHDFRVDVLDSTTVRWTCRTTGTMRGDLRLRTGLVPPTGKPMRCPPEAVSATFNLSTGKVVKLCTGFCLDRQVGNTEGTTGVTAAAFIAGQPVSDWELYPPATVLQRIFARPLKPLPEATSFLAPFPETVMVQLAKGVISSNMGYSDTSLLSKDFAYITPTIGPIPKNGFVDKYAMEELAGVTPNFSNFRVDPYDPARVWVDFQPNAPGYQGAPQAMSFSFDDDGFCTRISAGAVMDPSIGNGGGLGGPEGLKYAMGKSSPSFATRPLPRIIGRARKGLLGVFYGTGVDDYGLPPAMAKPIKPLKPTPPPVWPVINVQQKIQSESKSTKPLQELLPISNPLPDLKDLIAGTNRLEDFVRKIPTDIALPAPVPMPVPPPVIKPKAVAPPPSPLPAIFGSSPAAPKAPAPPVSDLAARAKPIKAREDAARKQREEDEKIRLEMAEKRKKELLAKAKREAEEKKQREIAAAETRKKEFEEKKRRDEEARKKRDLAEARQREREAKAAAALRAAEAKQTAAEKALDEKQREAEEKKQREIAEARKKEFEEKKKRDEEARKKRELAESRRREREAKSAAALQAAEAKQAAAKKALEEKQAAAKKAAEAAKRGLEEKQSAAKKAAEAKQAAAKKMLEAKQAAAKKAAEASRKAVEAKQAAAKQAAELKRANSVSAVVKKSPTLKVAAPASKQALEANQKERERAALDVLARAASRATINLFGLGDKGDVGGDTALPNARSKTAKQAPKGVPTLTFWRKNRDGSVSGRISGSKAFTDGERVTTSPVTKGTFSSGEVVTTGSGSRYFLD